MCGIAGLLGRPSETFADRVTPMLAHRGPDDRGAWRNGSTCLVQTRLAILDLSSFGHQPMGSPDGRWQLVFNGEIYNHWELRRELEREGQTFHGSGDTEVLLAWLIRRGPAGLPALRGMYAFALVDTREGTALLGRDPHGIKPLYLWHGPAGELAFASEVRALLASGLMPRQLDQSALAAMLATGSVPEPLTLVAGVRRLPAGHVALWRQGQMAINPVAPLPESQPRGQEPGTLPEAVAFTRAALERSVAAHMVSDVPVGLFLSSGLDSAALLALAPRGLHTFTIGFEEAGAEAFDESAPAAAIATHFGAVHTPLSLSAEQALEWLPEFLACQDQPSLDGYNTWCVSRLAHREGLKVALSGLGGDELFGGYPSFRNVPRLRRWRRRLGPLAPAPSALLRGGAAGRGHKARRVAALLAAPPTLGTAYDAFRGLFTPEEVEGLLRHWGLASPPAEAGPERSEPPADLEDREAVAWLEGTRYLRNQLLPDSDAMAMASALELRLPLVDATLQRQLATVAPGLRLAEGKDLLRRALPELPTWFTDRPKQGFRFPFQLWLDQPARRLTLRLPTAPAGLDLQPWYRRWTLMVLEHWLRVHLDLELPVS